MSDGIQIITQEEFIAAQNGTQTVPEQAANDTSVGNQETTTTTEQAQNAATSDVVNQTQQQVAFDAPSAQQKVDEWYKALSERTGMSFNDEQSAMDFINQAKTAQQKLAEIEPDLTLAQLVKTEKFDQYQQIKTLAATNESGLPVNPIELAKSKFFAETKAEINPNLSSAQLNALWTKHLERSYPDLDLSEGEPNYEDDEEGWLAYQGFVKNEVKPAQAWANGLKSEIESQIKSQSALAAEQQGKLEALANQQWSDYIKEAPQVIGEALKVKVGDAELAIPVNLGDRPEAALDPFAVMQKRWGIDEQKNKFVPDAIASRDVYILNNFDSIVNEIYNQGRQAERAAIAGNSRNTGPANAVGTNGIGATGTTANPDGIIINKIERGR